MVSLYLRFSKTYYFRNGDLNSENYLLYIRKFQDINEISYEYLIIPASPMVFILIPFMYIMRSFIMK